MMTRTALSVILLLLPLVARTAQRNSQTLPPGPSVQVKMPPTAQRPPNLTVPQQKAVEGPVPNTWEAWKEQGQMADEVGIHDFWIKELQTKVESLDTFKTYVLGILIGIGLFTGVLVWMRKPLVRQLMLEAFPTIERFVPKAKNLD